MKNNRRYRKRLQDMVDALKDAPCTDCGHRFPPKAMDFDHLDASTKVANVSTLLVRATSSQKILEEIAKCELVCSNCHRLRTAKRLPP